MFISSSLPSQSLYHHVQWNFSKKRKRKRIGYKRKGKRKGKKIQTAIILACKFTRLIKYTKLQTHQIEPDVLRLDSLSDLLGPSWRIYGCTEKRVMPDETARWHIECADFGLPREWVTTWMFFCWSVEWVSAGVSELSHWMNVLVHSRLNGSSVDWVTTSW